MTNKHVLVVDDEAAMREIVACVLRDEGYSVATAPNGAEALVELTEHRPDVVLLDLYMPELDGEEFIRYCRARPDLARLPIALCSSSARASEIGRALGVQTISKPFDVDELIARVGDLVPTPTSGLARAMGTQKAALASGLGRGKASLERCIEAMFAAGGRLELASARVSPPRPPVNRRLAPR